MTKRKWNIGELNRNRNLSEKTKRKISIKLKSGFYTGRKVWNKGINMDKQTRKKISEALQGRQAWNKNKRWNQSVKEKISASKKGTAPWNKGVKRTQEEKEKMSLGAKRMWERRKQFYQASVNT